MLGVCFGDWARGSVLNEGVGEFCAFLVLGELCSFVLLFLGLFDIEGSGVLGVSFVRLLHFR